MDFIYSRKRIRMPKIKRNSSRNKKKLELTLIILLIISVVIFILEAIYPIFQKVCEDQAQAIATKISNDEATKVMANYNYNKLVDIEKDEVGNINMVKTNIISINEITSSIANNIVKALEAYEDDIIYIRMGSFTGSKILSGMGPSIPIKIASVGSVSTNLESEFTSTGINQTLHRIYLEVTCSVTILTPFKNIGKDVVNQVLLAESVIVGNVPDGYYNLEGIDTKETVPLIEKK